MYGRRSLKQIRATRQTCRPTRGTLKFDTLNGCSNIYQFGGLSGGISSNARIASTNVQRCARTDWCNWRFAVATELTGMFALILRSPRVVKCCLSMCHTLLLSLGQCIFTFSYKTRNRPPTLLRLNSALSLSDQDQAKTARSRAILAWTWSLKLSAELRRSNVGGLFLVL